MRDRDVAKKRVDSAGRPGISAAVVTRFQTPRQCSLSIGVSRRQMLTVQDQNEGRY